MQHPVCWLGKIASTICTSSVRLAILAGLFGSGVKTLDSFALVTVGKQFHSSARRLVAALLFLRWDSSLTSFQWILHRGRAVFCLAAAATKVQFLLPILFFFPHVPSLRKHCCVVRSISGWNVRIFQVAVSLLRRCLDESSRVGKQQEGQTGFLVLICTSWTCNAVTQVYTVKTAWPKPRPRSSRQVSALAGLELYIIPFHSTPPPSRAVNSTCLQPGWCFWRQMPCLQIAGMWWEHSQPCPTQPRSRSQPRLEVGVGDVALTAPPVSACTIRAVKSPPPNCF